MHLGSILNFDQIGFVLEGQVFVLTYFAVVMCTFDFSDSMLMPQSRPNSGWPRRLTRDAREDRGQGHDSCQQADHATAAVNRALDRMGR